RPPRRLDRSIPAELETIVLKAMEKNPASRYATAGELTDDLQRFLKDEPIRARRPTPLQRARKWGRRHPALVASGAVALAVAVVALSVSAGWVANDRAARRAWTAVEARKALDESEDWQRRQRLPDALSAARRALGVLPPGSEADPAVRRAAEARVADLELLSRLEELWSGEQYKVGKGSDVREDRHYGEVFREANLDVDALPADEAGERIGRTTVAVEVAAHLDNWSFVRRRSKPGDWKHLLRVARAADRDGWRTRLREALERQDAE